MKSQTLLLLHCTTYILVPFFLFHLGDAMKRKSNSMGNLILKSAGLCQETFWDGAKQRVKDTANRGCQEAFNRATDLGFNVCVPWRSAECRSFRVAPDTPNSVYFRCSALVSLEGGGGEEVRTFADCVPDTEGLKTAEKPSQSSQRPEKKRGIGSSAGSSRSGPPPQASTIGFQPQASTTGFQPQASTTGFQPQASTTAFQPQASTTAFQPQASTTGFQPQALTTGFQPQASTAGFNPGPRYDPSVYANYRPYAPRTQPSTTLGSSLASGSKFSCLVGDSYGARPTYGTGPPRSGSIPSSADLQLGFGRGASYDYGTYSRGGSLTIGASRTGGQGPEPPGDDLIAAGVALRQKKGKTPVEERPFICNECGYSYESNKALQAHMKSHTEETYCAICEFNLSSVSNYNRHMQQHQEFPKQVVEKNFRCTHDQCSKSYTTASNLREHSKSHAGETFCPYCFKYFATVGSLRDHISNKHKGEQNMNARKKSLPKKFTR